MAGTVGGLMSGFNKKYGQKTVVYGNEVEVTERVPTGIFELDMALGGGIPRRQMTVLWGKESSNKTNVALSCIRNHMLLHPHLTCVFIDLEHTFDPVWASTLGVDVDKLVVVSPDYAEQAIDMVQEILQAEDVGIIVLDSIAAMMTSKEFDKSSEVANVGGTAFLTTSFVKRMIVAINKARKQDNWPTMIVINQMRNKIGVMYGSPETQSGGFALQHAASAVIRLHAKKIKDPKVDVDIPVIAETTFTWGKTPKFAYVSNNGKFNFVLYPHKGLRTGECDDWNTIEGLMKDIGYLTKGDKKGWVLGEKEFATLKDVRQYFVDDPLQFAQTRKALIQGIAQDNGIKVVSEFDGS